MDYSVACYYYSRLIEKLKLLDIENKLDFTLINKAIYWAKKHHDGQFRKSGEPFYTHPLEVAYMVSDYNLKTDVIVTSILHDIIEDTEVTIGMIVDGFSWRIAEMVDRLTRDRLDGSKLSVEKILSNSYEKDDKEVLLIKLFDRLHNLQTLNAKSPEKIKKILLETIGDFIWLAAYLNMLEVEQELTTICCQHICTDKSLAKKPQQEEAPFWCDDMLLSLVFQNNEYYNKKENLVAA